MSTSDASRSTLPETVEDLQAEVLSLRTARDRLREVERRLREQNSALVSLSRNAIIASGDVQAAVGAITETASRTLDIERVSVWLFDEERTMIRCVDLFQRTTGEHLDGQTLTAADYPEYFAALESGRTVAAHDARTDPRTSEFRDAYLVPLDITSMMDAPIRHAGRIIGVVCHEHVGTQRTWTLEDEAFAGSIADYIALSILASEQRAAEATLGQEQNVSSRIIDSLPGIFYLFDDTGRYLRWNKNHELVGGYSSEEMRDRHPMDFIAPDQQPEVRDRIAEVFRAGHATVEADFVARDGTRTPYFFTGARVEVDGTPCLAGMGVDITERKLAEEAVRESERRLRQVLDSNPALIFAKDRKGRFTLANRSLAEVYGTTSDAMIGKTDLDFAFNPEEVEFFRRIDLQVMNSLREHRVPEEQITDSHGNVHWMQTVKRAIVGEDGVANQVLGVATDITERKRAEQRQTLMIRELDHRVKNNLAAVLSVADETVARAADLESFAEAFRGRIHAMAIAHDMLASTSWEGAEVRSMVERLVQPFRTPGARRCTIEGPSLLMPAELAPPFAMILHELTTNAVKHGALSNAEGQVAITWSVTDTGDDRRLRISWIESGGPALAPPERRGFGTEFIEEIANYQLRGSVDLTFEPTGLRCQMELPVPAVSGTDGQTVAPDS
jgi:PAS domain S-box-containing protein